MKLWSKKESKMKIIVPLKQVPDLVEELEIAPEGNKLDISWLKLIINEADDHALEEAIILKEKVGGEVTAISVDMGEVDDMLFNALARGADKAIKLRGVEQFIDSHTYAKVLADTIKGMEYDLVFTGVQAVDDIDGQIGILLAAYLDIPYIGLVTKVEKTDGELMVSKEYAGGIYGEFKVSPPCVLGVLASEEPPRYVPISKLRQVMKTATIEEMDVSVPEVETGIEIVKMYKPEVGKGAEIIEGSPEEVTKKIVDILIEKGILR